MKKSGNKPILSPEGEKTLYYYIKTRIAHGQKVTAAWAMGLAAILAKKDGIEFKTQHGGPSFGWWMRFKTRHPELGLLNSPDKEPAQSPGARAPPQLGLAQSASGDENASASSHILHATAADTICPAQEDDAPVFVDKPMNVEEAYAGDKHSGPKNQTDVDVQQVGLDGQMDTQDPDLERRPPAETSSQSERQENLNYPGQMYC